MPPAPFTGSAMNAATVFGPSRRIASSSHSAVSPSVFGSSLLSGFEGGSVWLMFGTSGPKYFQNGGSPVIEAVASVLPWYERGLEISLFLPSRPWRFQ